MNLDEYQVEVRRTANAAPMLERVLAHLPTLNYALGLAGEAGEFIDLIKKMVFHGHEIAEDKIIGELGDVLWYVAAIADSLGLTLEGIAQANVTKLRKRYPEGFSITKSQERADK